ncbi:Secreted frizzled-related protein 1, partial [Ophiophagus hannah]
MKSDAILEHLCASEFERERDEEGERETKREGERETKREGERDEEGGREMKREGERDKGKGREMRWEGERDEEGGRGGREMKREGGREMREGERGDEEGERDEREGGREGERMKIKEVKKENGDKKIVPRKKKALKLGTIKKKELKKLVLYLKNGADCPCHQLDNLSHQFLIMGRKVKTQYLLTAIHKWDKKNKEFKKFMKKMKTPECSTFQICHPHCRNEKKWKQPEIVSTRL